MLGKLLCWIGFHRWEFQDVRKGDALITLVRCVRVQCPTYFSWSTVNRDQIRRPW